MTTEEAAVYIRLSRSEVYETARDDEIPCSKVADRWRFLRSEIDERMLWQRPSGGNHGPQQDREDQDEKEAIRDATACC